MDKIIFVLVLALFIAGCNRRADDVPDYTPRAYYQPEDCIPMMVWPVDMKDDTK